MENDEKEEEKKEDDLEKKEKASRLPQETLRAIKILAGLKWNDTEIATALGINRKSVAVYRPDELADDVGIEKEEKKIDTTISAEIFTLFAGGKNPIDAVTKGYKVGEVKQLWDDYRAFLKTKYPTPEVRKIQKQVGYLSTVVLHLMKNLRAIASTDVKNVIKCPKCLELSYLTSDWVCSKCGKEPFTVDED